MSRCIPHIVVPALLTVTINTHIIIGWPEFGQAPNPEDSDRQEVAYPLRESMSQYFYQMSGHGIGGAIRTEDFARTGELGAGLYAGFVDSDDAQKACIEKHGQPHAGHTEV